MQSSISPPDFLSTQAVNTGLVLAAEIGVALATTSNLQEMVFILRKQLKWVIPAQYLSLCVLDDSEQYYSVITEKQETQHFSIDEGIVGWVLRHHINLNIPDLLDESRLPPGVGGIALHKGQGSLLVLTLKVEQRFLGVLTIGSATVNAFAQVDRGFIELITLQVASAVHTALLVAELDGAEAIIASMAKAVEAKDAYTQGHAGRVTAYALALVDAARLSPVVRDVVAHAGPLHDVGKIGVPDYVLGKPGRLTGEEFDLIKQHPVIGDEICRPLRSLRRLLAGIRNHHERYDGRGYPDGLAGENIPLEARVLAIADTYDAMTSNRPYRSGMSHKKAISILRANEGPQWDPALIPLFCNLPLVPNLATSV